LCLIAVLLIDCIAVETPSLKFTSFERVWNNMNEQQVSQQDHGMNLPPFAMLVEFKSTGKIGWFRLNTILDAAWLKERLGFHTKDCAACAEFVLGRRGTFGFWFNWQPNQLGAVLGHDQSKLD
jgi:hypothetical protein